MTGRMAKVNYLPNHAATRIPGMLPACRRRAAHAPTTKLLADDEAVQAAVKQNGDELPPKAFQRDRERDRMREREKLRDSQDRSKAIDESDLLVSDDTMSPRYKHTSETWFVAQSLNSNILNAFRLTRSIMLENNSSRIQRAPPTIRL